MTMKNAQITDGQSSEPVTGVVLQRLVRPIGFPPAVWHALLEIREAQKRLEDDYPCYNESGKRFAVESAAAALRHAHANIMTYVAEVSGHDA
jgi:hypothetical protein